MNDTSEGISTEDLLAQTAWLERLARSLVGDPATADDAVQETWLVALRGEPRSAQSLRGWLAGILRNVVRHEYRGRTRRRRREARVARPETGGSTDTLVESTELQRDVIDAVLALGEPERTTVLQRYVEGMSAAEIARREGCPASTVRTRLQRALETLRSRLDDTRDGDRSAWASVVIATWMEPPARTTLFSTKLLAASAVVVAAGLLAVAVHTLTSAVEVDPVAMNPALVVAPPPLNAAPVAVAPEPAPVESLPLSIPGQPVRFTGHVVDALGAPVEGATVHVLPGGWTLRALGLGGYGEEGDESALTHRTEPMSLDEHPWNLVRPGTTDAEGHFEISTRLVLWHAATWTTIHSRYPEVVIKHPERATRRIACMESTSDDGAGSAISLGVVTLEDGGAMTGRVVDELGAPRANIDVEIRRDSRPDDHSAFWLAPLHERIRTDDNGRFVIDGVARGPHAVDVYGIDLHPQRREVNVTWSSAIDEAFDVGDVLMPTSELLAGVVVDGAGVGISGAEVFSSPQEPDARRGPRDELYAKLHRARTGTSRRSVSVDALRHVDRSNTTTDAEGRFALRGLSGQAVDVFASHAGFDPRVLQATPEDRSSLRFELAEQGVLEVVIIGASSAQPIETVQLDARRDIEDVPDEVLDVEATDAAGVFAIRGVTASDVTLIVAARDLPRQAFRVAGLTDGSRRERRTITLIESGAVATGFVVDASGHPVADARIVSSPLDVSEPWRMDRSATTSSDGEFTTETLMPGEWRVVCLADGYVTSGQRLTVSATEPAPLRFELVQSAAVSGRVFDADGDALAGAGMTFHGPLDGAESREGVPGFYAHSNEAGAFVVDVLAPGDYAVEVERVGTFDLSLAPGERLETEFRVDAAPVVYGNVTLRGRPVVGLTVIASYESSRYVPSDVSTTDADGNYELPVTRREPFTLSVRSDTHAHVPTIAMPTVSEPRTHMNLALPDAELSVRVVDDSTGLGIEGARVDVAVRAEGSRYAHYVADHVGEVLLNTLPVATFSVSVSHPAYVHGKIQRVDVTGVTPTLHEVRLQRGGGSRGFIYEHDGSLSTRSALRMVPFTQDENGVWMSRGWLMTDIEQGAYTIANRPDGPCVILFLDREANYVNGALSDVEGNSLGRLDLDVAAGVVEERDVELK